MGEANADGIKQRKTNSIAAPPKLETDVDSPTAPGNAVCRTRQQQQPVSALPQPTGSPTARSSGCRSGVGDLGAGPRRKNSLSEASLLPWLCCMTPAISLFVIYSAVVVTSLFFTECFYILTAVLTFVTMLWISNLAISSLLGAIQLRSNTKTDWLQLLRELPEEEVSSASHIVILPNYRESEKMLRDTLENIGDSPLAKESIRVVLAMEKREGQAAVDKADRLIQQTSHLFADILATYHPSGLPGEVPGKSSNTQWAYRKATQHYGRMLVGQDLSKVFLTVGDADTLWHPQYFTALTYQGLTMPSEKRAWTIWQPPVLLARNLFTVPCVTRATSDATLMFELASLANQVIFPAFAYSAYSMTIALVSHPEVDGWDVDVIAEDHHMYCKCYFAALWERAHASKDRSLRHSADTSEDVSIRPQVKVQPVMLPAVSYLVESSDGYWASCWARFQQARRHSQGVVELGYALLQYVRLMRSVGIRMLPWRTHVAIWSILLKIQTLHITSTAQCFALTMATLSTFVPETVRWIMAGGLQILTQDFATLSRELFTGWGAMNGAQQALAASVGQISGVVVLYALICWVVIADLVEGRYHMCTTRPSNEKCHASKSQLPVVASFVKGPQTNLWRLGLFLQKFSDTGIVGYVSINIYAVLPVLLAGYSLFRRGTKFEYIVAAKPE